MYWQMPFGREQIEPTIMDMIYQFDKLKPPKFEGRSNPLVYVDGSRN